MLDTLGHDLRYSLRQLRRRPGFTAVALLTLALGIGASVAIFGSVYAVLLRPLPFQNAGRTYVLWNAYGGGGPSRAVLSPAEFADYGERLASADAIAAMRDTRLNLTGSGEPRQVVGLMASPDLFGLLGVRPALGRDFTRADGATSGSGPAGAGSVAILSHALWAERFGSDPSVVGRSLQLDGRTVTVVGVMPAGVRFPEAPSFQLSAAPDLWLPMDWKARRSESRGDQYLDVVVRAKPGAGPAALAADVARVGRSFQQRFPDRYGPRVHWQPEAVPLRDQIVGDVRPALLLLLGAVGLVLLIACANVAALQMARAVDREPEVALRAALGAGAGRIARQLLTESGVLAAAGSLTAIPVALWALRAIAAFGPADVPGLREARLGLPELAFAVVVCGLTSLLTGVVPALRAGRTDLRGILDRRGRGTTAPGLVRGGLAMGEVTLAVVLLVAAGLLFRSLGQLRSVDPGFRAPGVLTFRLAAPANRYGTRADQATLFDRILSRLRALPGVTAAAAVDPLPLSGQGWSGSFVVAGRPVPPGEPGPHAELSRVTPGYLSAMGIPLVSGRDLARSDGPDAQEAVLVDRELAERYWPGRSALGERIAFDDDSDTPTFTVVGVVGHVRRAGPADPGEPQIYIPFRQHPFSRMSVVVRTTGDPRRLEPAVRSAVHDVDPDLPVSNLVPLRELERAATAQPRFDLWLVAAFSVAGLLLAALGIYGVMASVVAARRREVGVRLALGARPADELGRVFVHAARLAGPGLVAGLVLAAALSRLARSLLFEVSPGDPLIYLAAAGIVLTAAALAVWIPARRATRVDPISVLREA
jgi:putative ABC transport system permease protein